MPYTIKPKTKKQRRRKTPSFKKLTKPVNDLMPNLSPLNARGNKPLQMTFEDELNALIYYHLEEHSSGRHLLQALKEDDFARTAIAPPRRGSKRAVSSKLSIPEVWNNSWRFLKPSIPKPRAFSPANTGTWEIWSALTGP